MRYFYNESSTGGKPYKNQEEFSQLKREQVLKVIKPICEVFKIKNYDYVINNNHAEYLELEGQKIGCFCNSIGATCMELIGYIFVNTYAASRSLGAFEKQTLNVIKQYWR